MLFSKTSLCSKVLLFGPRFFSFDTEDNYNVEYNQIFSQNYLKQGL